MVCTLFQELGTNGIDNEWGYSCNVFLLPSYIDTFHGLIGWYVWLNKEFVRKYDNNKIPQVHQHREMLWLIKIWVQKAIT